jgi:hypothetical protein
MSNWNPKPLRPENKNPLFQMNEEWTVKKSLSPIEKQRLQDGTPHTAVRNQHMGPGKTPGIDGPDLYVGEVSKSSASPRKYLEPDDVVKSFLAKGAPGQDDADEDEEKSESMTKIVGPSD